MARVNEYKRSVDAVTTEGHYEISQFKLGDVSSIRMKQEPCDTNDEDVCTSDNNESKKYMPNNMPENNYNSDKIVCCLTKKEIRDNVPDDKSENKCNDKNTVCCSHEIRKSEKRKQHERHSLGDKDDYEDIKALQKRNGIIKSNKRRKQTTKSKRVKRDVNNREKTTVHCKICFLKFNSPLGLHCHNKSFERKRPKSRIRHASCKRGKIACNFCHRMFKIKSRVQSHLFHLHLSDLGIAVDGDKKDSLSSELSNSNFHTPKKLTMRQTTLFEYMFSPEKSECSKITNDLNNSNVYSQSIIKQEIDLNDGEPDLSMNTSLVDMSLQNEIRTQPMIPNQPFVKIHVHSATMKVLLGIDQNHYTEPSENNNENSNSGKIYALRSLNSSKELNNEELSTVVNKTEPVNISKQVNDKDLLSICKKCSVTLVRCDDKQITKLTSQFNTPSAQVLGQNNCLSPKRTIQQPRNMNVKIPPTLGTPRKAIPIDSSSTSSTPKGLLSFSPPSKITMLDFPVINNLSEQLANRRSSHEQIVPSVEKTISSENTNATEPEALSSQEESDLTNIKNTQPTISLKLKELKVSLLKMPQIKKELDGSNIFYCNICDLPFSSEKNKDKHIRQFHMTYISSICSARCNSRRYMMKHYLQEHCIWGCNRCCVCRKFFRSRLSLQRHLLLHCIKVILSKNDKCLNMITKCKAIPKIRKRTTCPRPNSIKHKEIADVGQENVNVNNVDNIACRTDKHKANDGAGVKIIDYEQQERQINETAHEVQNSFETNVIYLLTSNNDGAMELTKEPVLNSLHIINDSPISNNGTQTALISNQNTVPTNVSNDNKSVSILLNTGGNTNQKYPCSICGKQFQKIEFLWQHKRTYTQSLRNSCATCGLCFSNRKILRNHINSTHDFYLSNLYKYHCQFCNQGFRSETNLRIHELHYHATVETTGKQNVAELLQVSSFKNNLNTSETMCNVCGRNFNSYDRYQLHCMYYHRGHVFACTFCDQIFQGLYMLHHHNKLHHYPESTRLSYTYHCPICYEGFMIETHFHGHMAHVHPNKQHVVSPTSKKKSYECSKCHLEFSTIMELMVHVEHYTDGGNYQCQQCRRKCCTLAVLNEHINLSHSDRLRNDYKCSICKEVLLSSTSLLCHKKHVHQYVEDSTDITFTHRTLDPNLDETESNIHGEVIPVIAGSENEFVTSNDSPVPMNTSNSSVGVWGKCNIFCPICGVTFDTELFLKKHLAEYLDVGDYKCEKCQRRFANYEFLRKHVANHMTPGMPLTKYYCSVCNENFQSSIVYESHVAHLHANIIVKDISSSNV